MGIHAGANSVPSIPTRFQSYGYESTANGKILLQDPVNPGFSGVRDDKVGPCDYDPKVNLKYKSTPKANFSKVNTSLNIIDRNYYSFCIRLQIATL